MKDYQLTEDQAGLKPGDCSNLLKGGEPSPLPGLVEQFGPGPLIYFSQWFEMQKRRGGYVWIPSMDNLLRASKDRNIEALAKDITLPYLK